MKPDQALHLVQTGEIRLDDGFVRFSEAENLLTERVHMLISRVCLCSKYPWARYLLPNVALRSVRAGGEPRRLFTEYVEALDMLQSLEAEEEIERMGTPYAGDPESDEVRRTRESARKAGRTWLKEYSKFWVNIYVHPGESLLTYTYDEDLD